jgi:hypothetical protein
VPNDRFDRIGVLLLESRRWRQAEKGRDPSMDVGPVGVGRLKSGDSPFRIAFRFGVIRMMLTGQPVDGQLHGSRHKEDAGVIRQSC